MSGEIQTDRDAARAIGKAIWSQQHREQHPNATPDERKAAWQASKAAYVALGAKVYRNLARRGYKVEMSS